MLEMKYTGHGSLLALILLSSGTITQSLLWCEIEDAGNEGPVIPDFPAFYSTNIQVNDETEMYSMDIRKVTDTRNNRSATEVWFGKRHVKYIILDKELLTLEFKDNDITCSTTKLSTSEVNVPYQEEERVLLNALRGFEAKIRKKKDAFVFYGIDVFKGIPVWQWQLCDTFPEIDGAVYILISFTLPDWRPSYEVRSKSPETKFASEVVQVELKIPGELTKSDKPTEIFAISYSKFAPLAPSEDEFQIPENVYCSGFRTNVQPPDFPNYFSYQAEIIMYSKDLNSPPFVSLQKIYYDFDGGKMRIDLQESLLGKRNLPSPSNIQVISIIQDFNLGIQYTMNPLSGSCIASEISYVFDAVDVTPAEKPKIPDPKTFFSLKDAELSYTGQYQTRGITSKVFSSSVKKGNIKRTSHWYFSTDKVQLIEEQQVEKNVLVKMISTSESVSGKKYVKEMNLFNFLHEEPNPFTFDIASCFNESQSKSFVLVFSGEMNSFYTSSTTNLKLRFHQAIIKATGVNQQRILVQQMDLQSPYLYVYFKILDVLPIKPDSEDKSVDDAIDALQQVVSGGNFTVLIRTKENLDFVLRANTDGLKEYPLKESSVTVLEKIGQGDTIGLSIGMLIVGLIIGAALVNIIISRKHGVSLFQKAGLGTTSFDNPINESGF